MWTKSVYFTQGFLFVRNWTRKWSNFSYECSETSLLERGGGTERRRERKKEWDRGIVSERKRERVSERKREREACGDRDVASKHCKNLLQKFKLFQFLILYFYRFFILMSGISNLTLNIIYCSGDGIMKCQGFCSRVGSSFTHKHYTKLRLVCWTKAHALLQL